LREWGKAVTWITGIIGKWPRELVYAAREPFHNAGHVIAKHYWDVRFVPKAEIGTILETLAIPMGVASRHSLT